MLNSNRESAKSSQSFILNTKVIISIIKVWFKKFLNTTNSYLYDEKKEPKNNKRYT